MKKILIAVSIILCTGNAFAEPKNGFGDSMECYLETDGKNPICTKCNSTTEIWDAKTKKCLSRAEGAKNYHQISSATMKKCWQCPNNEFFKHCAIILSLPDADQKKEKDFNDVMNECKITSK